MEIYLKPKVRVKDVAVSPHDDGEIMKIRIAFASIARCFEGKTEGKSMKVSQSSWFMKNGVTFEGKIKNLLQLTVLGHQNLQIRRWLLKGRSKRMFCQFSF